MEPLASENVVISAPMSFSGSRARLWKLTHYAGPVARRGLDLGKDAHPAARIALFLLVGWLILTAAAAIYVTAVIAIPTAWLAIVVWYVMFGLLLVPYRLIRRGSRKRHRDELRHREILDATRSRSA